MATKSGHTKKILKAMIYATRKWGQTRVEIARPSAGRFEGNESHWLGDQSHRPYCLGSEGSQGSPLVIAPIGYGYMASHWMYSIMSAHTAMRPAPIEPIEWSYPADNFRFKEEDHPYFMKVKNIIS